MWGGAGQVWEALKGGHEGTGRGEGKVWYVDISDPAYDAKKHQGVTFAEAMETIHVLKRDKSEPLRSIASKWLKSHLKTDESPLHTFHLPRLLPKAPVRDRKKRASLDTS